MDVANLFHRVGTRRHGRICRKKSLCLPLLLHPPYQNFTDSDVQCKYKNLLRIQNFDQSY